jgi:pSer/pThr/pTyr-binding forkhead associated (FHA) protein
MTPSGTPAVRAPVPSNRPRARGNLLLAPARLLHPAGTIELESGLSVVIGRDASCEVVLEDPLTSRRHATISVLSDAIVLEDCSSTNGVYLNGVRIFGSALLRAGDSILIGATQLSAF